MKNKAQNLQAQTAEEKELLLWPGPWRGTLTAAGMRRTDCTTSRGGAGTGGSSAYSSQPTDSGCISVEDSVGTGRSFAWSDLKGAAAWGSAYDELDPSRRTALPRHLGHKGISG